MFKTTEGRNIPVIKMPMYANIIPNTSPFNLNYYVFIFKYPFIIISMNTSNASYRNILKNKFLTKIL